MLVRPRLPADVAGLVGLLEVANRRDGYPPHWPPGDPADFVAGASELATFVVQADDGAVVGHAALHGGSGRDVTGAATEATGVDPGGLGFVARVFVDPDRRRAGVGRRLLDAVTTEAAARALVPVLDVWEGLSGAIALYESCGWRRLAAVTIGFRSPCTDRCRHEGRSIDSFVYVGPTP